MRKTFFLLLSGLIFIACNNPSGKQNQPASSEKKAGVSEQTQVALDTNALVKSIDTLRISIEQKSLKTKPVVVKTKGLREQIVQKWSEIQYVVDNGQITRIKTVPYAQITKRTEEFYFDKGALVLAVVEDKGSSEEGKNESVDKMYYYNNGECISEVNKSREQEYNIRQSDRERLVQEAEEYVDIYKAKK